MKIIVLTGQTATGKTNKAIELAHKYDGEIINFDSRQIYKKLDVITGKDLDITDGNFHIRDIINDFDIGYYNISSNNINTQSTKIWLYDIIKPSSTFSVFDYKICALHVIEDVLNRNKTPILVGGTYFYLKELLYSTVKTHVEPNPQMRKDLETKSVEELQQILKKENYELFQSLNNSDKHNPHRLIRKIEITRSPTKDIRPHRGLYELYPKSIEIYGYYFSSKDKLTETITKRVENRLQSGALAEVESLLSLGFNKEDPGLKTIGYVQIIAYLQKQLTLDQMKTEWITKEIQYAKRQLTFMKQDRNIHWNEI